MTWAALLCSIVIGAAALAWGYWHVGLLLFARWIIAFGVLWLVAAWRRWRWFSYLGIAIYFLAAALGLWFLNFPPGWMFAGATAGLAAWDLTHFQYRQRFAASDEERRHVESRHIFAISVVALLGFLLASLAMAIKLQFSFEWAVLLTLVLALSLAQIIRWFRRRG